MCWSETASFAFVGIGATATVLCRARGEPPVIWLTLGYFTAMEALQAGGYMVIDQCGTTANRALTLLSILHIIFQPFVINAFIMAMIPPEVRRRIARWVYGLCAVSAAVMLVQLLPIPALGQCQPGTNLCGDRLCLVSGDWHLAWDVPFNGLMVPVERALGTGFGFPTYMAVAFVLPALYGAWRFALVHALLGPILAGQLTSNPNEVPAIWCLVSLGIVLIGAVPAIRRHFLVTDWPLWPRAWRA